MPKKNPLAWVPGSLHTGGGGPDPPFSRSRRDHRVHQCLYSHIGYTHRPDRLQVEVKVLQTGRRRRSRCKQCPSTPKPPPHTRSYQVSDSARFPIPGRGLESRHLSLSLLSSTGRPSGVRPPRVIRPEVWTGMEDLFSYTLSRPDDSITEAGCSSGLAW